MADIYNVQIIIATNKNMRRHVATPQPHHSPKHQYSLDLSAAVLLQLTTSFALILASGHIHKSNIR